MILFKHFCLVGESDNFVKNILNLTPQMMIDKGTFICFSYGVNSYIKFRTSEGRLYYFPLAVQNKILLLLSLAVLFPLQ